MSASSFTLVLLIVAALVATVAWAVSRLAPVEQQGAAIRAEWPWLVKGLVIPFLLWVVMNLGISNYLQPFLPRIQFAQNAGLTWFPIYLRYAMGGLLIITSYWAALSLADLVLSAYRRVPPEFRMEFRAVCFTSLVIAGLPAALLLYLGGWANLGFAGLLVCAPMIGYGAPILNRPKRRPMYSRAVGRMKMGKYSDAEQEIIRQLEQAETDFDGWLLLAELHATRFGEILEAEKIILDVCLQPETTSSQISVALHKLADWQLSLAKDHEAAARTLQLICDRLPGTHLAHMAELRRSQLLENKHPSEKRPIPVPVLPSIMPALQVAAATESSPHPAALAQVNELSKRLTQNPNNISDREQLARLLAEPLGKPDLAIEQIELLLDLAAQPDVKRVEWLTLIAGWQIQLLQDEAAAQITLTRIVKEFPGSPQAFTAQRRLNLNQTAAKSIT
jgi:tetratricopeptide (TPR) repeat protein